MANCVTRSTGCLLLCAALFATGACKKRTVTDLKQEVLQLIKKRKVDEAAKLVADNQKLFKTPLERARFYGEIGWTPDGLKAYGEHLAQGGAPKRFVLEDFLGQVWALQATKQWSRRDFVLLARQAGFGDVEVKFPGLLDSVAEMRRGAYFEPWLHALGESRIVEAQRFFEYVIDNFSPDAHTAGALAETLARFGDKRSLGLLRRAVEKYRLTMQFDAMAKGIGRACETSMTDDRRLEMLTVIDRMNELSRIQHHTHLSAARIACRDKVTQKRLLKEAAEGGLNISEEVDVHFHCVDPSSQLAFCEALVEGGDITTFEGFETISLDGETKALDACLWKAFKAKANSAKIGECDTRVLWAIRDAPSAMKKRLAAGAKHDTADVKFAYVPMAFAHGLLDDRDALRKHYKDPEGGRPTCPAKGWRALVVNPTEGNLAALDEALAKADVLLAISIIEGISHAPTPATAALIRKNAGRIKEWGVVEHVDRLLCWQHDRGDGADAEALALELATAENGSMRRLGLKWLTRSQSKKATAVAIKSLGLTDEGLSQTMGAIVLWAQAMREAKGAKPKAK